MHDPVCPVFEEGRGSVSRGWGGGEGDKVYKQKVHVFTTKIGSKMHTFESIFPNFLGGYVPGPPSMTRSLQTKILGFYSKNILL